MLGRVCEPHGAEAVRDVNDSLDHGMDLALGVGDQAVMQRSYLPRHHLHEDAKHLHHGRPVALRHLQDEPRVDGRSRVVTRVVDPHVHLALQVAPLDWEGEEVVDPVLLVRRVRSTIHLRSHADDRNAVKHEHASSVPLHLPDLLRRLKAVELGHVDVHQDEVKVTAFKHLCGEQSVRSDVRLDTHAVEQPAHELLVDWMVVCDEHAPLVLVVDGRVRGDVLEGVAGGAL
mmetsp:Transcript_12417/g.26529  ORF Transcript_12417/g.26529 Transcript_12417/m.26529 type:complete len:230 (+) Transcript_12417:718-1407(+)